MGKLLSQREAYRLMFREYPDVVSAQQMCQMLNITEKTGYKLLRENKINGFKVGRAYKIPKIHVMSYLNIAQNPLSLTVNSSL